MKFDAIEGLHMDELRKRLRMKTQELFELKMKNAMRQLPNPLSLRTTRRQIAQLKTAIRMKRVVATK